MKTRTGFAMIAITGLTIGIPAASLAGGAESPNRADPEPVVVGLANGDVLEFVAYERADLRVSEGSDSAEGGDPAEAVVRYWGSSGAIAMLGEAISGFNSDAEDLRDLPLGIAPFSNATLPTSESFDAVAVFRQDGRTFLIFADAYGAVGVRFAGGLDLPDREAVVTERYEDQTYVVRIGCTASAGDCSCTASGAGANCEAWHDSSAGMDRAECTDSEGTEACWAKGGKCGCAPKKEPETLELETYDGSELLVQ